LSITNSAIRRSGVPRRATAPLRLQNAARADYLSGIGQPECPVSNGIGIFARKRQWMGSARREARFRDKSEDSAKDED